MDILQITTVVVSVTAIGIAIWQGVLAKQQLDQAKQTKTDTERLLDDIKYKVNKIESISDETRRNVENQISKLIDKQDENFKLLLNAPQETNNLEFIKEIMPLMVQNPKMMETMVKLSKDKNK